VSVVEELDDDGELPLVVIPCGKAKLALAAPAKDLYTGTFFRLALRAARALTSEARILILSGRHGLVGLQDVLEPYDLRLGQPFSLPAMDVVRQADRIGLLRERPILLLPAAYDLVATQAWPRSRNPLRGASGIGSMQHRLREIAETGRLP
jgi:hypothetical protein